MTTPAAGPSGPRATFGQRLLAALIDGILLSVVTAIFGRSGTLASLVSLVIGLAYYIYLEGSPSGQTVGKKVMNIRVVGMTTGTSIEYSGALIRHIGRYVSAIPCLLGFFWMLWDPERQTWHDKFANSAVVPVADYPVADWPG